MESVDGAGEDVHLVFGVILGARIGERISIDGKIYSGIDPITNDWGHDHLLRANGDGLYGAKYYCDILRHLYWDHQ